MRALCCAWLLAGPSGFLWAADPPVEKEWLAQCEIPTSARVAIPRGQVLSVLVRTERPTWLAVAEMGHELKAQVASRREVLRIDVPKRIAGTLIEVRSGDRVRLHRSPSSTGAQLVDLGLMCTQEQVASLRLDWTRNASRLSALIVGGIESQELPRVLEESRLLRASAISDRERALSTHLRAQLLMVGERSALAAAAFSAAETEWQSLGLPEHVLAARTARVEDLVRAGGYQQVLQLTRDETGPGPSYWGLRLQQAGCAALRYTNQNVEARRCLSSVVHGLRVLEEIPDLATALMDLAEVERLLDRTEAALGLAEEVRALPISRLELVQLGRNRLLLADIAFEQGRVVDAIGHYDSAVRALAASPSRRWEANAMLRASRLYRLLGASGEASALISSALDKLSPADAPARVAMALMDLADVERDAERLDTSDRWLESAARIYEALGMPMELDAVGLRRARLALQRGLLQSAAQMSATRDRSVEFNHLDWILIESDVAARSQRCVEARVLLARIAEQPLSLARQIDHARVTASCTHQERGPSIAEASLAEVAQRGALAALSVEAPVLRSLLAQRMQPLAQMATGMLLPDPPSPEAPTERLWWWLAMEERVGIPTSAKRESSSGARRFDRAVARELIAPATAPVSSASSRELLSILGRTDVGDAGARATSEASVPALAEIVSRMPSGTTFLAHLDGGDRGAWLVVDRAGARVVAAPAAAAMRRSARGLNGLLTSPQSSLARIDSEARKLSATFAGVGGKAPQRLWVYARGAAAVMPWPVLRWPGADEDLGGTSEIALVRAAAGTEIRGGSRSRPALRLLIADQPAAQLARLEGAAREPELIAHALQARPEDMTLIAPDQRDAVLAAFAEPGQWLHVAAHGTTRSSRLGRSGIWLQSSRGSADPQFLSWIDILEHGARNELVVLGACDLAGGGNAAIAGNLGFADAVSQAGARHVVAAQWSVSDSASAQWLTPFYAALSTRGEPDVGRALLQARRHLRASRTFRHPFYWASYVHLTRIP